MTGLGVALSITLKSWESGALPGPGGGMAVQSNPLPLQRVRSTFRMNGIW